MLSTIVRSSRPILQQTLPRASLFHTTALARNATGSPFDLGVMTHVKLMLSL